MDGLTFLTRKSKGAPQPIYVVCGEEVYLRRRVLEKLRQDILGGGADDMSLSVYPGDKSAWVDVRTDLETLPFLSPRRLVIVEDADPFVTKHRKELEKYTESPAESGVLVLDVKSWPSNTKLAKLIDKNATLTCKAPAANKLAEWARQWAVTEGGKELAPEAASLLVDLVGPEMGLLTQELAKLVAFVGERERIESAEVDKLVGNNRMEKTFAIFDLIGQGKAAQALAFLDRLLTQGEDPMRLLGAFGWQLRKLGQAMRMVGEGYALSHALSEAGFNAYAQRSATQQLKHLGRRRGEKLFDWLLEIDLGIKGNSALPPRVLLERLVVQLAKPNL